MCLTLTLFVRWFVDDSVFRSVWLAQRPDRFQCEFIMSTWAPHTGIPYIEIFSFLFFAARAPNLCVQLFDIFVAEIGGRYKFLCLCVINCIHYSVEENAQIHLPRMRLLLIALGHWDSLLDVAGQLEESARRSRRKEKTISLLSAIC